MVRQFCDGAICAGHLLEILKSEWFDEVSERTIKVGRAIEMEHPRQSEQIATLLLHEHPWVRYFAAVVLLLLK